MREQSLRRFLHYCKILRIACFGNFLCLVAVKENACRSTFRIERHILLWFRSWRTRAERPGDSFTGLYSGYPENEQIQRIAFAICIGDGFVESFESTSQL